MQKAIKILHPGSISNVIVAKYCDNFSSQFMGLMFKNAIHDFEGLLLVQARDSRINSAIHMLFMKFDIAVIWINSEYTVVDKTLAKPWKLAIFPTYPARFTLECHPDRLREFHVGEKLEFSDE